MILRFFLFTCTLYFLFIPTSQADELGYVALGDSYTAGTGVDVKDIWPAQLAGKLKGAGVEVSLMKSISKNGWTAKQLIAEGLPALKNQRADFVTVLIGVNDWVQGATSKDFSSRLNILLDGIQEKIAPAGKLLLITSPNFSCSPAGRKWGYGKSAKNGITRLNNILKTEAASRNFPVVDIFPLSEEVCSQPAMFSADGLHPSREQYARWVELIFPIALDLLSGRN
jgi:lysophospholipase L1-like esterase